MKKNSEEIIKLFNNKIVKRLIRYSVVVVLLYFASTIIFKDDKKVEDENFDFADAINLDETSDEKEKKKAFEFEFHADKDEKIISIINNTSMRVIRMDADLNINGDLYKNVSIRKDISANNTFNFIFDDKNISSEDFENKLEVNVKKIYFIENKKLKVAVINDGRVIVFQSHKITDNHMKYVIPKITLEKNGNFKFLFSNINNFEINDFAFYYFVDKKLNSEDDSARISLSTLGQKKELISEKHKQLKIGESSFTERNLGKDIELENIDFIYSVAKIKDENGEEIDLTYIHDYDITIVNDSNFDVNDLI